MTEQTLGEAIREARRGYGARIGGDNSRRILSTTDFYQKCRSIANNDELFDDYSDGGKRKVEQWEKGKLAPGPTQRRIMETALHLRPFDLDLYLSKEQRELDQQAVAAAADGTDAIEALSNPAQPPVPAEAVEEAVSCPEPVDWIDRLGGVDPTLEAGVRAGQGIGRRFALPEDADADDDDILDIWKALRADKRLTVVTGQPFLGKKAKVKGMLRKVAQHSDSLTLELTNEDGSPLRLPIRAWSARRVHYRELVERVHDFLSQYHDASLGHRAPPPPSLQMPGQERALDELIEQINQNFTQLPAVFIFTDVDAFGANYARNVVRDLGIEQLVRTLLDANKQSRIIITTTDFEGRSKTNPQLVNFPQHHTIEIEEPHFWEVKNFVDSEIRDAEPLLAIYDCDVRVRGDDLVSLGALINLTYDLESEALPEHAAYSIDRFKESTPDGRDVFRREIYRQIVDAIAEHQLLHPIALVAASEDGVRADSMRYLLHRWNKQNPKVAQYSADRVMDDALSNFVKRLGHRFLRQTGIARYDEEEYDCDERHHPDDLVWEMDPIISMYFLDALRVFDERVPAYAHRLIALIARLRSQQKKVQMRSPIGSRASEEGSRDIQCYVNLLASILYEKNDSLSVTGPPLRLSEAEIFAIDHSFSAARALRFAVFCLLKEDIDHDHRLTMIFDEDALRLDLFLLLFQELGRVYTPEFETLELPDELPDHLTGGLFTPEEILDLMSTIALSAYHAQRSDVVDKIVDLAGDYAEKHGIAASAIELSRIWCCKIDASMRLGRWRSCLDTTSDQDGDIAAAPEERDLGQATTLGFVRAWRRDWYPDLFETIPNAPILPADLSRHKAHLRLLIREADLATFVDPNRETAAELYGRVEKIEAALSMMPDQHDPVVLSGRAGRRYIQFLLNDPDALNRLPGREDARNAIFDKVEALLSVNKSRLRRFSGADRVGVMLDMARLKLARGDLAGANHFAESAKRRAFSGSVSHGGKLDVFQVLAEVKLSLVGTNDHSLFPTGQDARRLMKDAEIAIRNLRAIASHLGYAPSLAMAHLLEARLALACHHRRRRRAGVQSDNDLRDAREAIGSAREVLSAIHQVNLNEELEKMDGEIRRHRTAAAHNSQSLAR